MVGNKMTRWAVGVIAVAGALILAAPFPLAAASSGVSRALQQRFVAINAPIAKQGAIWAAVTQASQSSPWAQAHPKLDKIGPPYAAALQTFDNRLAALRLPGKAGVDAVAVIKDDKQFIALLHAVPKMTKSQFVSAYSAIVTKEVPLALTFNKDLGLPVASSYGW